MEADHASDTAFVIKAVDLAALNFLPDSHPRPVESEWINRATDQVLRPMSVEQMLRTLHRPHLSDSAARLRENAGLRLWFAHAAARHTFARDFASAHEALSTLDEYTVLAVFERRQQADRAIGELLYAGVPKDRISKFWRASRFMDTQIGWQQGHSPMQVAGTVAGTGIAGALFGLAVFSIPGVGPVAASGAILASTYGSMATVSGMLGATGGAIARMLDDVDVDEVAANHLESQIRTGKTFLTVDTRSLHAEPADVAALLRAGGGEVI